MEDLKEKLLEAVIDQIKFDFLNGNYEAVDELLNFIPKENLIGFLPEREWFKYKELINK